MKTKIPALAGSSNLLIAGLRILFPLGGKAMNLPNSIRALPVFALLCCAALLSACGGGGGGGGGGSPAIPPFQISVNADRSCDAGCENLAASAKTGEFGNSGGLSAINAHYAYARRFSGQGVKVAVVDSGVDLDHAEFAGRIVGGYNAVNPGQPADDNNGHGTGVAGIIASDKDGARFHGVAYNAEIVPIKVGISGEVAYDIEWERALNHGLANAFVLNNSWGGRDTITFRVSNTGEQVRALRPELFDSLNERTVAALRNADNRDRVVVFSAGNDGWNSETGRLIATVIADPANGRRIGSQVEIIPSTDIIGGWGRMPEAYPELVGHWLNVVAVDSSNVIAKFSNGCGDARHWCLAAPGVRIRTSGVDENPQIESGTSFAAPHVSGAAAILKGAFPNLSAKQIVRLLLITARDLGKSGVDTVYGYGLLDLEKATRPQTYSGCVDGYKCPRGAALRLAYSASSENKGLALDDFAFAPLADSRIASSPALSPRAQNVPVGFLDGFDRAYQAEFAGFVSPMAAPDSEFFFSPQSRSRVLRGGFYARSAEGEAPRAFGWRRDRGGVFADVFQVRRHGGEMFSPSRPGTGFAFALGAERARGAALGTGGVAVGAALAESANGSDITHAAMSFSRGGDGWDASWESGLALEEGSALGAKFGGAFAVRRARTFYGRLSGSFSLTPRVRLFASGTAGRTRAEADLGAIADFSQLRARGWSAGFAGDAWRLSFSRPLRTSSGTMRIRTAGGYDDSGAYAVRESVVDLSSPRAWRASAEWMSGELTRLRSEVGENGQANFAAEFLF